jgi:hypothetical protein
MFENEALREIVEPKEHEVSELFRTLHNGYVITSNSLGCEEC